MIVIDGPNTELKNRLKELLIGAFPASLLSVGELERTDLPSLVRFVHQDLRYRLQDGWPIGHLADCERYMLMNAIMASGGVVFVVCMNQQDDEPNKQVLDRGVWFPSAIVADIERAAGAACWILEQHIMQMKRASQFSQWACAGSLDEGAVMLVGEANQDLVPGVKRRAFISDQGCSLYLQEAMRRNAPTRYYLTNAQATGTDASDKLKLQREIELIKPRKIVALGVEAAAMLASQKVPFTRTWHPQYWKRFRNGHMAELVQILKP